MYEHNMYIFIVFIQLYVYLLTHASLYIEVQNTI